MGFKKFEHIKILLGWGKHEGFVRFRLKRRHGPVITQIAALGPTTIPFANLSWAQTFMVGPDNTGELPPDLFERLFYELAMANVRGKEQVRVIRQVPQQASNIPTQPSHH